MGRRALISATTINRIISASNRRQRERERQELINAQGGNVKELPPTYQLVRVDFNNETRNAKVEFLQEQNYRTIVRYVTQNYVRYPIYSDWKVKHKTITKTVKLTNSNLESLNTHSDNLIRKFSRDIIVSLDSEDLYPSWFLIACLEDEYKEKLANLEENRSSFSARKEAQIQENSASIKNLNAAIDKYQKRLSTQMRKHKKLGRRYDRIVESKNSIAKSIFTLFIYNALLSQKRKDKYKELFNKSADHIVSIETSINENNENKAKFQKNTEQAQKEIAAYNKKIAEKKHIEYEQYKEKLDSVTPLAVTCSNTTGYAPIKMLNGFEYKKIIGCYVIHNRINDKCYVGQSKDVIRRLRQHFKGTVPNNIIFAEDYYSATIDLRDDLFEFKIIECSTKDELDSTEKLLIDKYNAYRSGYNGTSGNT